jgi:hypothetical protein
MHVNAAALVTSFFSNPVPTVLSCGFLGKRE